MRKPELDPGRQLVVVGADRRLGGLLLKRFQNDTMIHGITSGEIDLKDPDSIRRILDPLDYDRLILADELADVDYCEDNEDEAFAINADGPRLVAEISAAKGAHVTYFSNDFVFGGFFGRAYPEERTPRPLSVYGASKLEGEESVLEVSEKNLVVRVSWLYGAGDSEFPEWIIQQALERDELSLPGEKLGCPTYAKDVVEYLRLLLCMGKSGVPGSGIFHVSNSGKCSWQEWGQFCLDAAAAAGLPLKTRVIDANFLEDMSELVARRPLNSVLDTSKFSDFTGVVPRPWEDAMREHFSNTLARRECEVVVDQ